jgi:DNA-binding GntR family transcriptional regulator
MEPIERGDTLADMAYERLRSALMSGNFRPGDALSIRQLASLLGISATPARDAIARVLWERGLENGPHRTVVVPVLSRQRVADIYDLRLNLEGRATSSATARFRKADIAVMEEARKRHIECVDRRDYKGALAANESFHFTIYERAENIMMVELIRGMWLQLGPSLNLLYPNAGRNRPGVHHHANIAEAIKKGDPDAARLAVEADLKDGWAEVDRALFKTRDRAAASEAS